VAKVGTSKAGGTKSQLGRGTSVAFRGRPWKQTNKLLMMCGEIIAVHSDNYTKHINNSKQNVTYLTSLAVGIYRHHCTLRFKGLYMS
jgi:DNA-directed RNA polymerase subunit N (RpoN/RPB10)